ncbi:MAG TPA: 3'-5' exonuclease [Bacteroidales bacterium]|nr:3'-5' exonuclease [Bacteroidales bacterium]HRZ75886.1 3'-5' exonuclease [Bacteroidales bacterium]
METTPELRLNLSRPLAFFDLETTGTNLATDRIVEIFILKILPEGDALQLHEIINPGMPIPPEVTAIHGISDADVADKPDFTTLAPRIAAFIECCDLAGYNAIRFDIPILAEELLRAGMDFDISKRYIIDVQNIFHKMEPRHLAAAFKFYCGKPLEDAHTAEADTRATYEILMAQIARYRGQDYTGREGATKEPVRNDIRALHEFSAVARHADLAGHIVFDGANREVFNFGKYKGRSVEEVFAIEPSYYDWMMKSQFPEYTKKVITGIQKRRLSQNMGQKRSGQ